MTEYEDFNDSKIYLSEKLIDENEVFNILANYFKLLDIYHLLFKKNIATKKVNYEDFIYKQGMKCIKNVFIILLHHTRNINFTHYHCEKGIYYFTEFISQIENENSFLKLSSVDAIIFVYKKTIYNINKKFGCIEKSQSIDDILSVIETIMKMTNMANYSDVKDLYPLLVKKENIFPKLEMIIENNVDKNTLVEELKQVLV